MSPTDAIEAGAQEVEPLEADETPEGTRGARFLTAPRDLDVVSKAVKAAGTKDTDAVVAKLKELPVDDSFAKGKVLANGRFVHDLYLFEVKKPEESKKPWDYYKQVAVVPGDQAFPTAKDSGCPLTK